MQKIPLNQKQQHKWDKIMIIKRETELKLVGIKDIAGMKALKNRGADSWLHTFHRKI